jgi:hypothetical protein
MPIRLSDLLDKLPDVPEPVKEYSGWNKFMELNDKASKASGDAFPGQDWDNTQRNAARHSIWMGLIANQLGGGPIARTAAKGLGYANEAIGLVNGQNTTREGAIDMRHDLNNNAVGLNTLADLNAQGPVSEQQIIDALIQKAKQSQRVSAPSVLAPDVGVLTRGQ